MMLARATPSAVPQKATSMATAADATPAGLPETERMAVELRGVTVRYKGVAALSGIGLSIREGEFFSLLGPSGCGKTTTLNIVGGFIRPDDGEVLIQGRSVGAMPSYRRPVNTVFQSYALFPHMTVAENVGFGPRMAGERREDIARRVREALALVSLAEMGDRRPSQLSGGQQQRVAVARALVNRPSVLLLDEPLGALDLKLRKQMQRELSRIQREVGITFVYVTHDQEEAMTMSDRIAVMNRGAVVQVGTPQQIYEHPASLFVADFIGSSNILVGELAAAGDALAEVRLATGKTIRVPRPAGPASSRVSVVVRPDHMGLSPSVPAAADMNAVGGSVSKVSFLGDHLQVVVRSDVGSDVTVRLPLSGPQAGRTPPQVGDKVQVGWPIARSLCFSQEPE